MWMLCHTVYDNRHALEQMNIDTVRNVLLSRIISIDMYRYMKISRMIGAAIV